MAGRFPVFNGGGGGGVCLAVRREVGAKTSSFELHICAALKKKKEKRRKVKYRGKQFKSARVVQYSTITRVLSNVLKILNSVVGLVSSIYSGRQTL